jgi:hypothetical protein
MSHRWIIACVALLAPLAAQAQITTDSSIGAGSGRVVGTGASSASGNAASIGATGDRLPGRIGSTLPSDSARRSGIVSRSLIPAQGPARTGLLGGETYERPGVAGRPYAGPLVTRDPATDSSAGNATPSMSNGTAYDSTLAQAGQAARGGAPGTTGGFGTDAADPQP